MSLPPAWETPLFAILLYATAASGLVLLFGYAASFAFRRPALRIKLVLATLAGALIAPLAGLIPGYPHLSLERKIETVAPTASEPALSFNTEPSATSDFVPDRLAAPPPALPRRYPNTTSTSLRFDWRTASIVVWLSGLALSISWWIVGLIRLRRLLRSASPATAEAQQILADLAGKSSKVRLLESDTIAHPLACWWLRPTIVLPRGAESSPKHLRWQIAHEWAHLAHGDAIAWLFASIVHTLLYHQPLAWLLCRRLRFDQDLLADAAASEAGASEAGAGPADYADFLLAHARAPFSVKPQLALGMAARRSQLYRRVVMLLHHREKLERTTSWKTRLLFALAAIVLAIGAGALPLPKSIRKAATTVASVAAHDAALKPAADGEAAGTPKTPKAPNVLKTQRENLRYAGKSFAAWKIVLETDLEPKTRIEAINALASFGAKGYGEEVDGILAEVLASPDDDSVHVAAISVCEKLGSQGFNAAKAGAKSENTGVQRMALKLISSYPAELAVPLLIDALQSPDWNNRSDACVQIASFKAQANSASAKLIALVRDDESDNVRGSACFALGEIGSLDAAAQDTLTSAMESDIRPTATSAAMALLSQGVTNDRVHHALVEGLLQPTGAPRSSPRSLLDRLPKTDFVANIVRDALKQANYVPAQDNVVAELIEWIVDFGPTDDLAPVFKQWAQMLNSSLPAAEGLAKLGVRDNEFRVLVSRRANSAKGQAGYQKNHARRWSALLKELEE